MNDFFELDFLDVETKKSGDAIAIRYAVGGEIFVHVVDGGYQDTGRSLADHIDRYYGYGAAIDNVVVTHPDGDHTAGLKVVLEERDVGILWMARPWTHAAELLDRFKHYGSVASLAARLKADFPTLADLEEIALRRGIPILDPFQGAQIGAFTVMAPSKARYLDLVVEADRTPVVADSVGAVTVGVLEAVTKTLAKVVTLVQAAWGVEVFSPEGTSTVNEMSVVQGATLCGERILLTGDVGRNGLAEAADYAPALGWTLPGIDRFQIPHHGSRRNVSTELLDRLLGPRLAYGTSAARSTTAIVSAAKADAHHPRKSVIRAVIHRGAQTFSTEVGGIQSQRNAPGRGWGPIAPLAYPNELEE